MLSTGLGSGAMRRRLAISILLAAAALAETIRVAHGTSSGDIVGVDIDPYLRAAAVVRAGHGHIYADPFFVYLPTSAVLLAPFTDRSLTYSLFAYADLFAVAAGVYLAAWRSLRTPWWPAIASAVWLLV